MPVEVSVDVGNDLVTLTVTGLVGTDEMLRSIMRVLSHPSFRSGIRVLTDMRSALHGASGEEVRRVAQLLIANRDKMTGVKNAVVVGQTATYGIMRMLQLQTEGFPFEFALFYDIDQAREWLSSQ